MELIIVIVALCWSNFGELTVQNLAYLSDSGPRCQTLVMWNKQTLAALALGKLSDWLSLKKKVWRASGVFAPDREYLEQSEGWTLGFRLTSITSLFKAPTIMSVPLYTNSKFIHKQTWLTNVVYLQKKLVYLHFDHTSCLEAVNIVKSIFRIY